MDTGGSEHDVHSSDCTEFTGKFIAVDHHVYDLPHAVLLLIFSPLSHHLKSVGCVSGRSVCVVMSQTVLISFSPS